MLFTSTERYNFGLEAFNKAEIKCYKCDSNMSPYTKPFGKNFPDWRFLIGVCDNCGSHIKQLYEYIPEIKEMMDLLKRGL